MKTGMMTLHWETLHLGFTSQIRMIEGINRPRPRGQRVTLMNSTVTTVLNESL